MTAVITKPYHTKRAHSKSRAGCKTCKRRRVKCDESRPTCHNCILRNEPCIYPSSEDSGLKHWPSTTTTVSSDLTKSAHSSTLLRQPLFMPSPDRGVDDMKLLWFYTTNAETTRTVYEDGRSNRINHILKSQIPRLAFETPFLMDCLLATSALQLQLLNQEINASRAVRYRARACQGYREAIEEARPETFPALIACSLLLTNLSSHMFREEDTKELYIIDWMILWRGICLVIEMVSPRGLWESGMAELIFRPSIDLNQAALNIPSNLLSMILAIEVRDPEFPNITAYHTTLGYLGSLYHNLSNGFSPTMSLRVITWFTYLPNEFVELCRQRKPRALVILGHYMMFLKTIDDVWWAKGISDREIRGIIHYLGDAWLPYLVKPRLTMALSNRLQVSRMILDDPDWESRIGLTDGVTSQRQRAEALFSGLQ
ncbi:hypothetical protein B0J13DRAFT_474079 [Dactylonectria estremocensis]|uniref:Zn(2)-C6 fungal-type domain-containing protein n=1 Tax=Dactylonectria estremocensis TaxID=1079267 RepID=A0A9P9EVL0_9HYPO|nr:hypothetical protein B0J13DRAFT_474079 [Dactylonectria estremocensis]